MIPPFVILSLPRSRSYWLSQWLGCAHDLGLEANTCQEMMDALWRWGGTVETGASPNVALLRNALPGGKMVTIRRDWMEVIESLERFGLSGWELQQEILVYEAGLDEAERLGAIRVPFRDLEDVNCCAWLWEYLTGRAFDFPRWQGFAAERMELSMPERIGRLVQRAPAIAALRAEAATMPDLLWLGPETWASMRDEGIELARGHFEEANPHLPEWYWYQPHEELLTQMATNGAMRMWTVRVNCRLMGYLMFTIGPDVESKNVLMADQGPWFMDPEAPSGLGLRLMNCALEGLKATGVQVANLHHPMAGRGAKLGPVFRRLGAIEVQHRYALYLSAESAQNA